MKFISYSACLSLLRKFTFLPVSTVFSLSLLGLPAAAHADMTTNVNSDAMTMQAYVPDLIVVFNAGTQCYGGKVQLDTNISQGTRDRLWATLLTAKVGHKTLSIVYETGSGQCNITSFVLN